MTRTLRWIIFAGLALAAAVAAIRITGWLHSPTPDTSTVWLSDFEVDGEYAVRWTVQNAFAVPAAEHATHGSHAAKVTFQAAAMPSMTIDRYLGRRNWTGFSQLSLDLYNPQPGDEPLTLQMTDQDGRSYEQVTTVKGKVSQPVRVPLIDVAQEIDLSRIAALKLFRVRSASDATFYVDALRLERLAGQLPPVPSPYPPATPGVRQGLLPTARVTPQMLGGLQFARTLERWRVIDLASAQPIIRVPLTLVGPPLPLAERFVVSGGVPFAMGQLRSDGAVRVSDAAGAIWPAQTRPMAVWPDGSVKWLLVTAQATPGVRERELWLEYGSSVSRDAVSEPSVKVEELPDAVQVTTGPVRFAVSKRRFSLFESAFADRNHDGAFSDDERLASAGDLVLVHDHTDFHSALDTQTYALTVEESGPLRATLKASGWFRDASGKGFCQFIVRIQAFAGLPQVRVYHTFIYTGYPANTYNYQYKEVSLPRNETIQEIRLELPTSVLSDATVVTADEQQTLSTPLDAPLTVAQKTFDQYELRKQSALMHEGARHAGWLMAQHEGGGVQLALRDAWQQYPTELSADPKTGQLTLKLWPASAGELNLETGPDAIGPDDVARGGAFGLGKTHELIVGFFDRPFEPEAASSFIAPWLEPWLLAAHPEWLQATDALGTLGPAQVERFTEIELMLDDLFSWAERQPKSFRWYGMLDYGDTLTWYRQEAYDKSYEDVGWHPEGRWGWHNCEAVGSHGGALVSFLRTLNLKYFRFAEAKARHVMDVDTVHYNTIARDARLRKKISDEFSKVGSMHRHSAYHWSGRNEETTHTNVTGLLLYYYLTGYDRAWDVANEVGSFLLLDPVTYTEHPETAPLRAIGNVVWGDVLLNEATGDPRYRQAADRWVRVLLEGQERDGTWPATYNPRTGTWTDEVKNNYIALHVLPALIAYHRLTGNPDVAQVIVKATNALIKEERYEPFFDALAYSYLVTGRGEYLDEGLRRARRLVQVQRHGDDPIMDGMVYQKAIYDHVGPPLYAVPFVLGGMDALDYQTMEKNFAKEIREREQENAEWGVRNVESGIAFTPNSELRTPNSVASYEVLVVPSTEKILPELGLPQLARPNPAVLSLARNEYEAIQLVLRAPLVLTHVTVQPSDLTQVNGSGVIPQGAITWSAVGFVKTRKPGYNVSHVGWWPDPLPQAQPFDVKPNWPQPIWLTVYAAPGTPAGDYTGTVTIHPSNAPAHAVQVTVRVWDFELPRTPSLKTAFDVYPNRIRSTYRQFFPQWWGRWEVNADELEQRFYDDLIRHRLAPVLNADVSEPSVAASLRRLSERGLSAFAIGRHGGSFGNNWPADSAQLAMLQPTYRRYAHELRAAGLLDRHYIYTYDEPQPGLRHVAAVARMIHAADSQLKNLVVLEQPADAEQLKDWFAPIDVVCLYNRTFDPAQAARLRSMGKELWLYVAGPKAPYPTLVIDYPAMAARILPWMCWKYGLTGLLYWSVNYWTTNPYQEPMNTKWEQNGNGSLYYPGAEGPVSSIRLELLRDGMEDYEYLALLARLVERVRARAAGETQALVQEAQQLLGVDPRLVASMRDYSTDPDVLATQRRRIAELIEQLQRVLP